MTATHDAGLRSAVRVAVSSLGVLVLLLVNLADLSGQDPLESPFDPSSSTSDRAPRRVPTSPGSLLQQDFPPELILPEPTEAIKRKANRFIPTTIDPELRLPLVVGRPTVLQLAETPKRIYTPTDDVIRTEIIDEQSGREVAVTGLQPGTATLIFWFDDKTARSGQSHVAYEVRVYADPLLAQPTGDLQATLNEKFPNSYIELDEIADRLIIRGEVPDAIEMSNILNVLLGTRRVRRGSQNAAPEQITATNLNFVPQGDQLEAAREDAFNRRQLDATALARAGIINQLKIVGEQQVMLKVTVAEVNRSAARSIGLNFGIENSDGFTVFESLTGGLSTGAGDGADESGANILASLDMGQIDIAMEALRGMNLSRTLAEPNLIAMNGQSADFQAGGQFPIPVVSSGGVGGNLQGVTFVPFGVQLQFTPFIQDRDVIRLQMNAEVSTRDESLGTSIGGAAGGTSVSGLSSRNFSTTVQLRSGQTIAVAGLLQTSYGATTERIPLWGDLPILGTTGGVRGNSSSEQEVVILVTPHLVAPASDAQSLPIPGDDVYEPSDIEFYIANRLESRRSKDHRTSVRTDYARQVRAEHCCPERFMIGGVGPTDRCRPQTTTVPHAPVRANPQPLPSPPGSAADSIAPVHSLIPAFGGAASTGSSRRPTPGDRHVQ